MKPIGVCTGIADERRNEAFDDFADWLMFSGKLIGHNDPDHQEKVIRFNELIANWVIYSAACDITDAANAIAAEGHRVNTDELATIRPTSPTPSAGSATGPLNLTPPAQATTPGSTWNPACCSRRAPDGLGARQTSATSRRHGSAMTHRAGRRRDGVGGAELGGHLHLPL
ncbi:Tn3 family transposase [Spirillospora sp. NPDC046719]